MRDLFGDEIQQKCARINIYADEIQSKKCAYTNDNWFYIGIIVEDLDNPLLDDIINERYCDNFDKKVPYFAKNDREIHWSEVNDIDTKNICKRWLKYMITTYKSEKKFYAYILGINNSKLSKTEFDDKNEFNSKYNRFFRSAVLYALKSFFSNARVIVKKIYHEQGQQQNHKYFPWHSIYKIGRRDKNIQFKCDNVTFLPKDHRKDRRSNIIQLCDLFLGVSTSILHGIKKSKRSVYREELANMFLPLFQKMVDEPYEENGVYAHSNRVMIRFFPKEQSSPLDLQRFVNQFYTKRRLYYMEQKAGQLSLF